MTLDTTKRGNLSSNIAAGLTLLREELHPVQRRLVRAGDIIYRAGQPFESLFVLNAGFAKSVNFSADGREQVVALHMRGDWMGLDGIAAGRYGCDLVALDAGEVWTLRYDALIAAGVRTPAVLVLLHEAMSQEIGRDRDWLMSLASLPADARVAEFLRNWALALAQRGLRTDQITLRMSRAEIGNYLGMTLESVSRALSRMARVDVIRFAETGRRDIEIPEVGALSAFIHRTALPGDGVRH